MRIRYNMIYRKTESQRKIMVVTKKNLHTRALKK